MVVKVSDDGVAAIEAILRRGNKAVVQRDREGIIVFEEKRKIEYSTDPSRGRKRAM